MISLTYNNVDTLPIDNKWNFGEKSELLMHTIHAYPAKFPAFIATKAFDYAMQEGVNVKRVADIFCGCGTVALEARMHNKDFWGCDINPVATLIAKTKSTTYNVAFLVKYYEKVQEAYNVEKIDRNFYTNSNERLKYWFTEKSFLDLLGLKHAIENSVPRGIYLDAFLCIFSSILKSIKPQVDPNKKDVVIWNIFKSHYEKLLKAAKQINMYTLKSVDIDIENENFLNVKKLPKTDLVISSPPYVTSYEYADLHQLSTLWLEYASDYRELRKGSIGSVYNSNDFKIDLSSLNNIGKGIVQNLLSDGENKATAKVRAIARYYVDMQQSIHNCTSMLNDGGMVFFVVGDTEYKGIKIKNSEHLVQCLENEGFSDIKAAKRKISNKLLTPYRDKIGRFSSDKTQRTVYHEEFIISGRMMRK